MRGGITHAGAWVWYGTPAGGASASDSCTQRCRMTPHLSPPPTWIVFTAALRRNQCSYLPWGLSAATPTRHPPSHPCRSSSGRSGIPLIHFWPHQQLQPTPCTPTLKRRGRAHMKPKQGLSKTTRLSFIRGKTQPRSAAPLPAAIASPYRLLSRTRPNCYPSMPVQRSPHGRTPCQPLLSS